MPLVTDPGFLRDLDAVERELFRSVATLERKVAALTERLDRLEATWEKRLDLWTTKIENCHIRQATNDEVADGLYRRLEAVEGWIDAKDDLNTAG